MTSRLFDGVEAFLQHCQAQHIRMACVTNKPEALARKLLEELDIAHYFDLVVGGIACQFANPIHYPFYIVLHNLMSSLTQHS